MLGNFFKIFSRLQNNIRVSNSFNPDQARHSVGPDLDPNSLQRLPADDKILEVCLFVCFVALRPKSTAMVIAGRSVHLATLFPGQA